jgi:hypothetical protein
MFKADRNIRSLTQTRLAANFCRSFQVWAICTTVLVCISPALTRIIVAIDDSSSPPMSYMFNILSMGTRVPSTD